LLVSKLESGARILDLGCGNGRAVKYFVDKGFKGTGVDISNKMLKLARENVKGAKFHKKDFTKLDFENNSFDAIISFFAFNHIEKNKFRDIISKCRRILKKEGFLLLGLVEGEFEDYFKGFYGQKMKLYGKQYTERELKEVLEPGFKILKVGVEHFRGKHFEEDDIFVFAKRN